MIFLSVNHNLLYTILGTYPPGPFRNNQNSPKKIPFFQHFQQHFSSAEISSMQNFSSAGNLLERPTVSMILWFAMQNNPHTSRNWVDNALLPESSFKPSSHY